MKKASAARKTGKRREWMKADLRELKDHFKGAHARLGYCYQLGQHDTVIEDVGMGPVGRPDLAVTTDPLPAQGALANG